MGFCALRRRRFGHADQLAVLLLVFLLGRSTVDAGTCLTSQFACTNGNCVGLGIHCDGYDDCWDNSDEFNCSCDQSAQFTCVDGGCVPSTSQCDGIIDCNDGSDEINCAASSTLLVTVTSRPPTTPSFRQNTTLPASSSTDFTTSDSAAVSNPDASPSTSIFPAPSVGLSTVPASSSDATTTSLSSSSTSSSSTTGGSASDAAVVAASATPIVSPANPALLSTIINALSSSAVSSATAKANEAKTTIVSNPPASASSSQAAAAPPTAAVESTTTTPPLILYPLFPHHGHGGHHRHHDDDDDDDYDYDDMPPLPSQQPPSQQPPTSSLSSSSLSSDPVDEAQTTEARRALTLLPSTMNEWDILREPGIISAIVLVAIAAVLGVIIFLVAMCKVCRHTRSVKPESQSEPLVETQTSICSEVLNEKPMIWKTMSFNDNWKCPDNEVKPSSEKLRQLEIDGEMEKLSQQMFITLGKEDGAKLQCLGICADDLQLPAKSDNEVKPFSEHLRQLEIDGEMEKLSQQLFITLGKEDGAKLQQCLEICADDLQLPAKSDYYKADHV